MKYQDLWIQNGDVVLDAGLNPSTISDRAVIAQDIVHAIIESGLAHLLIADRTQSNISDVKTRITILVEDDIRIMPGTVKIDLVTSSTGGAQWWVYADTIEFGPIETQIYNSTGITHA